MANYGYFYFQPDFNRLWDSLGEHLPDGNPRRQIAHPPVDPEDPYRMIHTGFFQGAVKNQQGEEREYGFYVPPTARHAGNLAFIFTGAKQTAEELYQTYDWGRILEKYETVGVFIAPDGDWDREEPGKDMDFVLRVLQEAQDNQYFIPSVCSHYALGLGSGAYMASLFSILYGSTLAAFAVAGESGFTQELAELLESLPSDGDPGISKAECPLPAWIMDGSEDGKRLLHFMRRANQCGEAFLQNDVAKIWTPGLNAGGAHPMQGLRAEQVWYSEKESLSGEELVDRMVGFVTQYRRWRDRGNGDIQLSVSGESMGLIRREITAGGLKRHFHIYEPSAYRKHPDRKLPLVIASHGFSCNGLFFAENTDWHGVAEEREFFVVYTTAYPRFNERFFAGGPYKLCPTAWWDSGVTGEDAYASDDILYFQELLQVMKREYPIDTSRIYATGHSNGAGMTQCLMRLMPKEFAAFAPVGGVESYLPESSVKVPGDGVQRPVWYMMGELDLGEGWNLTEGGRNLTGVRTLCACNHTDWNQARRYENGIYRHAVSCNEEQVPMVRFTGVKGWPHTYTREAARMIWDEFFCKYSRNEDGTIAYMGHTVKG